MPLNEAQQSAGFWCRQDTKRGSVPISLSCAISYTLPRRLFSPIAGPWYPISGFLLPSSNSIARSAIPDSSPGTRGTFLKPIPAHQAAKEKKSNKKKKKEAEEGEAVSQLQRRLGLKVGRLGSTASSREYSVE